MRVLSTEAKTPNGNKYSITRIGRIAGTGIAGVYGFLKAKNFMNSDEFVKTLTDSAKEAKNAKRPYFKGGRKAALIGTTTAIMAVCGFLAGGVIDFAINRILKKKADEKKA